MILNSKFAIQNHCNVQVTPLWQEYKEVQNLINKFDNAKKKYDSESQSKIMLLQHTFVSDDANELDHAAKKFSEFYAHFGAWFQNKRPILVFYFETMHQNEHKIH